MFRRPFSEQYPVSIKLFFKSQDTCSKQYPDCSLNRALLKTKSDWLWNNNLLFSLSRFLSRCWSCYDKAESTRTQTIGYSSFLSKSSLVLVRAVSHPFVYVSKSRENDTRHLTLVVLYSFINSEFWCYINIQIASIFLYSNSTGFVRGLCKL